MTRDALVASALAGAASGSRSFTGIGIVALTADENGGRVDRFLARPIARYGVAALAALELVADKLPNTPSRLELPGLIGRFVGAAASGAVLAQRVPVESIEAAGPVAASPVAAEPTSVARTLACSGAAVAAAGVTAFGGMRARAWAGHRIPHDFVAAVIEDAGAIGLAVAATR